MSKKKRRKFSPEEKVIILKKHLLENTPISDICDQYGLHPTVFYRWQKQLFENSQRAFEKEDISHIKRLEKKISILKDKLNKKNEVLSELMEEHVNLKKTLGEI